MNTISFVWAHPTPVAAALTDPTLTQRIARTAAELFGSDPALTIGAALDAAWGREAGEAGGVAYARESHTRPIWWAAGVACGLDRRDAVTRAWADRVPRDAMVAALRKVAAHSIAAATQRQPRR